jgi:hypothetical protein
MCNTDLKLGLLQQMNHHHTIDAATYCQQKFLVSEKWKRVVKMILKLMQHSQK